MPPSHRPFPGKPHQILRTPKLLEGHRYARGASVIYLAIDRYSSVNRDGCGKKARKEYNNLAFHFRIPCCPILYDEIGHHVAQSCMTKSDADMTLRDHALNCKRVTGMNWVSLCFSKIGLYLMRSLHDCF